MPSSMPPSSPPLSGWYVVSLRPVGQHRRLLSAAAAAGAATLSLPGLRLAAREDTPTRAALDTVLRCRNVIFTSPSAVRFAVRLRTLSDPASLRPGQRFFAMGEATRAALKRHGIADAEIAQPATSEGMLASPFLRDIRSQRVGLVTAPGGRGLLAETLRERGATLAVAEVYERAPARLNRAHAERLLRARGQGAVCITSAEALRNVLAALPEAARSRLLEAVAVTPSARLEAAAREAGFGRFARAPGPTPRALVAGLVAHAMGQRFR
jgi:uroporphyrinogen-III synthase